MALPTADQQRALLKALHSEIKQIAREVSLKAPYIKLELLPANLNGNIALRQSTDNNTFVLTACHPRLEKGYNHIPIVHPWLEESPETASPSAVAYVRAAVLTVLRRNARENALYSLGIVPGERSPDWLVHAHPLAVLGWQMKGQETGSHIFYTENTPHRHIFYTENTPHPYDLFSGRIDFTWSHGQTILFEVSAPDHLITVPGTVSDTALTALPGQLLSQLVELPRCNRHRVDDACANLVIRTISRGPLADVPDLTLVLEPTEWIAMQEPPLGKDASIMKVLPPWH